MKNLLMLGLVGVFSLLSVLEAEAGRRCGRQCRGCGNGCNTQVYSGGCNANGCQTNGAYVDPNMAQGAPVVDDNAPPAEPQPAR